MASGQVASIASTSCTTSLADYPGPLTSFPMTTVGVVFVTCTTIDSNNISASCLFSTFVEDKEPPQVTCLPSVYVPTDANANYATIPPIGVAGAVDNDPTWLFSSATCTNPATLPASPNGTSVPYAVTCTIADYSGNTATCTSNIVVIDQEAPVFGSAVCRL